LQGIISDTLYLEVAFFAQTDMTACLANARFWRMGSNGQKNNARMKAHHKRQAGKKALFVAE
jgi:hypothetical protein